MNSGHIWNTYKRKVAQYDNVGRYNRTRKSNSIQYIITYKTTMQLQPTRFKNSKFGASWDHLVKKFWKITHKKQRSTFFIIFQNFVWPHVLKSELHIPSLEHP